MSTAPLHRVILSYPTAVTLTDTTDVAAPRSWIQLARVGKFVSKRYGRFEINRADLAQMYRNFNEVTPKAPTELVVDYDHLSANPQHPGAAAAAGWMKTLELRDGGDTLWAEVEWTEDGAERIRKREYRFVSPSFIKDYVSKQGQKVGTTLIAAAITNTPFLEGMASLTLATPAIQAMNLTASLRDLVAVEDGVISLSKVGQRVSIEQADELTPEERGMTFVIADVRGEGDDAFVFLKTLDGKPCGWFRAEQLAPARSTMGSPIPPDRTKQEEVTMHDEQDADAELITLSNTIARERPGISLRDATIEAGRRRKDLADARRQDIGVEKTDDADTQARQTVITLHRRPDEGFVELVGRVQRERRIDLRDAIRVVSQAYPALAEDYEARG